MTWLFIAIVIALVVGAAIWYRNRAMVAGTSNAPGTEAASPGKRAPGLPLVGDLGGKAQALVNQGDAAITTAGTPRAAPSVSWLVGGGDPGTAIGGPKDGAYPS